ncbi:carbohydrate ABC transporter permease [Chitinilyticum aquatile]|uniref:carbohydrate ABC transporter permease n=1 Tax=Chitinilyticum aquatile TaxID=362520 RepID=UPI00041DE260|nr:carbohydrate ABC transporter permease [Chitinilyticum aquatile]
MSSTILTPNQSLRCILSRAQRLARATPELARYGILLAMTMLTLFPLVWVVSSALSTDTGNIWHFPSAFWPTRPGFFWFERVLAEIPFGRYLINSLGIAIITTVFIALLAIPCGYAFAMINFRGKTPLLTLLVITLMIPSELSMIPNYLTFSRLGLIDSYSSVIIPNLASAFGVLLMKQAFQDLPREVLEAARIDGAGEWQLLWHVALPMARPMVATLLIFSFVQSWNDYFWPSVVLKSREKMPLAVGIFHDLTGPFAVSTGMILAAVILAIIPALLLFALTQRFFISRNAEN